MLSQAITDLFTNEKPKLHNPCCWVASLFQPGIDETSCLMLMEREVKMCAKLPQNSRLIINYMHHY